MRSMLFFRWICATSLLLLAGCATQNNRTSVVIISTNDIHGAIEGMPSLSTLVKRYRAADKHVLLVDAGDKWTGNPYVDLNKERGLPIVVLMDSLAYDLATIGNHEFDHGLPLLSQRIRRSHFPTVLANVDRDTTCFPQLPAYVFLKAGSVKLGFLGLLDASREGHPDGKVGNFGGVTFVNPIQTALTYTRLKDSCDLLIGLTHLGFEQDSVLAVRMPQLGLIIGGHSHTVLPEGRLVDETLITQTGKSLKYAGVTRLEFSRRRLTSISNRLVALDTVAPDPRVARLVAQYKSAPELHRSVGCVSSSMNKLALMNLMTDAIIDQTKTDFVFYNWNGMRIDTHPAGAFTVADVFAMEPFSSTMYQLPMKLADLRELILTKFNNDKKEGHTVDIYPSGGSYTILTAPDGDGVDVQFYDRMGRLLTDEAAEYQVALPDYLHATYPFRLRGTGRPLDLMVTDLLMDYLAGHCPAEVNDTPRVTIRPRNQ